MYTPKIPANTTKVSGTPTQSASNQTVPTAVAPNANLTRLITAVRDPDASGCKFEIMTPFSSKIDVAVLAMMNCRMSGRKRILSRRENPNVAVAPTKTTVVVTPESSRFGMIGKDVEIEVVS